MSCQPPVRTISTVMCTAFSKGGATPDSDMFVMTPSSILEIAPMLLQLRATTIVENASDKFKCKAVFSSTDDGCGWDVPPLALENYAIGNRRTTTAWYTDVTKFKRGIRVGVVASNDSGANVEVAQVTLIIDFLLRS